jgi:hypothetical protein
MHPVRASAHRPAGATYHYWIGARKDTSSHYGEFSTIFGKVLYRQAPVSPEKTWPNTKADYVHWYAALWAQLQCRREQMRCQCCSSSAQHAACSACSCYSASPTVYQHWGDP